MAFLSAVLVDDAAGFVPDDVSWAKTGAAPIVNANNTAANTVDLVIVGPSYLVTLQLYICPARPTTGWRTADAMTKSRPRENVTSIPLAQTRGSVPCLLFLFCSTSSG